VFSVFEPRQPARVPSDMVGVADPTVVLLNPSWRIIDKVNTAVLFHSREVVPAVLVHQALLHEFIWANSLYASSL
jgi:hypothetical protein